MYENTENYIEIIVPERDCESILNEVHNYRIRAVGKIRKHGTDCVPLYK